MFRLEFAGIVISTKQDSFLASLCWGPWPSYSAASASVSTKRSLYQLPHITSLFN